MVAKERKDSADRDWAAITSSGPRPERLIGESALEYFMRQIEISNRRRRELGIDFWDTYPEDPRRYRWLQLTVHMPPHYPQDTMEWAQHESRLGPNSAGIDHDAKAEWYSRYQSMRETFWSASEVTDKERRFLWMGELEQRVFSMAESRSRGEDVCGANILEEVLAFASAYPEPINELDHSTFYWTARTVIELTTDFENSELFGWDKVSILSYAERLSETKNVAAIAIARALKEADGELGPRYANKAGEAERAFLALPQYPGDQPFSYESRIAFYHDQLIATRKFREIGAYQMWNNVFDREWRVIWIKATHWSSPTYAMHVVDAMHQMAVGSVAAIEVDHEALSEWDSHYANLRSEVWNHQETTDEERGQIRGMELWADLRDAQVTLERHRDKYPVMRFLDGIHELYQKYDNVDDSLFLAQQVLRDPKKLGLSDEDLLEFVGAMQTSKHDMLNVLAKAAANQIRLKLIPFEFEGETIAGESFRLADLRGRFVLIDHWATSCSSCIEAMPRLHEIYEQYRSKGFEVVSIAYDGTSQRRRIERIDKELGLTWTTVDGEGQWEEISEKYGYQGFPQYMLLNRDGTLYAGTGEVDMGRNLEALLDEMLAAEAAEKEAATVH